MLNRRDKKKFNINDGNCLQKETLHENFIVYSNGEKIKRDSKGSKISSEICNSQGIKISELIFGKDEVIKQKTNFEHGKISSAINYWENGAKKEVKEYDENNNLAYCAKFNKNEEKIEENSYYTGGVLCKCAKFINGKLLTEAVYDEGGNKKSTIKYNNGKKISEAAYSKDGNIALETTFDIDGAIAKQDVYQENGLKKSSIIFAKGIKKSEVFYSALNYKVEKEIKYNANGDKILETLYTTSGVKALDRKFDSSTKESEDVLYWASGCVKTITKQVNNEKTYELKCAENGEKLEESIFENSVTTKKHYAKEGVKEIVSKKGVLNSITMYDYNGEKYCESLYRNGVLTKERSYKENGEVAEEISYRNGKATREVTYWNNGNKKTEVIHNGANKCDILEYSKEGVLKIKKDYDLTTKFVKIELFNNSGKNVAVGFAKRFFGKFDLAICVDSKHGFLSPTSESYNMIKKLCFNIAHKTVCFA